MENKLEIGGNLIIGIESGSNTYGSYVKFSDGTMICYGTTPPINSGTLTPVGSAYYGGIDCEYNFPMAFVAMPIVSTTIHSNNIAALDNLIVTATKIRAIGIMSPQTSVAQVFVDYIAIGRWK